jgi:hypothetical protein
MADVECPHCGARFRAGRLACPECGSDARTGWKSAEDIDYLSVELPDGEPARWDAEAGGAWRPVCPPWAAWVVVLTILAFALSFVLRVW